MSSVKKRDLTELRAVSSMRGDRRRKKALARGTHHRSSFLYHNREMGEFCRLSGRLANCAAHQSVMKTSRKCETNLGDFDLVLNFEILRDERIRLGESEVRVIDLGISRL